MVDLPIKTLIFHSFLQIFAGRWPWFRIALFDLPTEGTFGPCHGSWQIPSRSASWNFLNLRICCHDQMINSSKNIILHLAFPQCFETAVYAMIYISLQAISKVSIVHGKSLFDVLDVSLMLWSILGLHSLSDTVDAGFYLRAGAPKLRSVDMTAMEWVGALMIWYGDHYHSPKS